MGIFKISHLQRLPPHYPAYIKAQFGHTQFVLDTIWARSESMQRFPESQAALTKILPGEEDRFGK